MTGWRIGYAAGNKQLIKAMTNLASHGTSNLLQSLNTDTIAAYAELTEPVETMRQAFEEIKHYL
ncbi:aminotransferase class I/II-fold pyridoxal phosphate-dependent enzyme [Bacillus pacificus]